MVLPGQVDLHGLVVGIEIVVLDRSFKQVCEVVSSEPVRQVQRGV